VLIPYQHDAIARRIAPCLGSSIANDGCSPDTRLGGRNRRKVDNSLRKARIRVAFPNTGGPGYASFTRYLLTRKQDKEGAIIDDVYNHGAWWRINIENELGRKLMGYFAQRDGATRPRLPRGFMARK